MFYLIVLSKVDARCARYRTFRAVSHRSYCRSVYERTSSKEQYVEITVAEEKRSGYLLGQGMYSDESALACEDGYMRVVRLCSSIV